jgi:hypothetical protein
VPTQPRPDVLDGQAIAPDRHDGVGARQAGRRPALIERDVLAGLGTRHFGDEVGDRPTIGKPRSGLGHGAPLVA